MQSITKERSLDGHAESLDAARSRPCLLCGSSANGVFMHCAERYRDVERLLVIARGGRHEVALVPVFWNGADELERAWRCAANIVDGGLHPLFGGDPQCAGFFSAL